MKSAISSDTANFPHKPPTLTGGYVTCRPRRAATRGSLPWGIVVTVFHVAGHRVVGALAAGLALSWRRDQAACAAAAASLGVLAAGAGTLFWHGLRHPGMFWGIAALVSGLLMMTAAIHLLRRPGATDGADARPGTALFATLLLTGLAACFLLYAVTLVRLNLDLPIIGT